MLNNEIRDLYINEKLSIREVAKRLNLNMWAVRSRMKRADILRRSSAETNAIKFLKSPLSYKRKIKLSHKEKQLLQAGLMLYWAEGSKRSQYTVDLANSDVDMLIIFLKVLRNIYQVDKKKLRVYLYCYSNQNPIALVNYWSNILNISKSQFTKPYVRQDFDPKKIDKMPRGMVHVRYGDKRLLMQIKAEIDIIRKNLLR
ncbi:MAG: hypothetical protein AAB656_01925 [Patescibacteria group bacterium]